MKEENELIQLELELTRAIEDINRKLDDMSGDFNREVKVGEVEKIRLRDISLEEFIPQNKEETIEIITHRMGFNLLGEKGRFLNVTTLHSRGIILSDNEVYMPYDYKITFEEDGTFISSQYQMDGIEKELLDFLHEVDYFVWFENGYKDRIVNALKRMGFELNSQD